MWTHLAIHDESDPGHPGSSRDELAPVHNRTYIAVTPFEWDPGKAAANAVRHSIRFSDAATVFDDERALTSSDEYPDEERYVTIGADALGRVLVVVYCWRGERIRIISARSATRSERHQYEDTI